MLQRFKIFALLLCLFALGSSQLAHARDSARQASDRKAIVAAYTNTNAAMMRKDVARAADFLASDFVYFTTNRATQSREQYVQGLVNSLSIRSVRYTLAKTEDMKIVWRGPDAIVYSTQITQLNGPGGVVYARTKFRDYWGKTSRGWQVRQAVEPANRITLNGRVFSR